MHADPIKLRVRTLLEKRFDVIQLFDLGWTDKCIANYYGSDRLTVKRVRRMYDAGLI